MSYVYQALVMLPTDRHPSLDRIKEQLQQVFDRVLPKAQIDVSSDLLTVAIDDWQLQLHHCNDARTLAGSQTIAQSYLPADEQSTTDLANYGCHIEVNCTPDEDPNMQRFCYYVSVLETLANLPGAIVFNPTTKGFIESVVNPSLLAVSSLN